MKFLADAMLGRLTRFLRIFGYNTVYSGDLEKFFNLKPLPDQKIYEYAIKTDRVILTKDYPFHKRAAEMSLYIIGEDVYDYLNQLKLELHLEYTFSMDKARCSECNSELKKIKNKEKVRDHVNHSTYKHYVEFFQCINPNCEKVFWNGPHIADIKKKMSKRII